ncbi:MAG: glycosyltransferase [Planctomycetes bacterium]|nr:glycosyltransferase [Planctomycetota bacterium]
MNVTTVLIAGLATASLGLFVLAWSLVVSWRARQAWWPRVAGPGRGVTVIKPLCGVDDDLEQNLDSFFRLEHEPLQLVFGAADPADPALEIVRRLARRHPHRDVAIVVGANHDAPNPKVGLQERLVPHARHDILLLSDANVRIRSDEVGRVLPAFDDPRAGLVYQAVVGIGEETLPAAIENLHYNDLAGVLAIGATLLTGQHAVNGKGEWVRGETLADVGGIAAVRDSAADDSALARLVGLAGWRVVLSPEPVRIVHRTWSWRGLWQRHVRHAMLRTRIAPAAYPLELLLNPLPWALLLLATPWAMLAPAVMLSRIVLEATAMRVLRGGWPAAVYTLSIPLKDAIYLAGWFAPLVIRHVHWRGRRYRLVKHARMVPVPAAAATVRSAA